MSGNKGSPFLQREDPPDGGKEEYSEVVPPLGGVTSKYSGERTALGGAG